MTRSERFEKLGIIPVYLVGYQPTEYYANTILNNMCTKCIKRDCDGTGCKAYTDCLDRVKGEVK